MNTPQEHANAVWRAGASPESLAGAITAYTEEIRGELHRANEEVERLKEQLQTERFKRATDVKQGLLHFNKRAELTAENAALREEVERARAQMQKPRPCDQDKINELAAAVTQAQNALKSAADYFRAEPESPRDALENLRKAESVITQALSRTSEEGKARRVPYAFCCSGDPATCDCVNKDHGTALDGSKGAQP